MRKYKKDNNDIYSTNFSQLDEQARANEQRKKARKRVSHVKQTRTKSRKKSTSRRGKKSSENLLNLNKYQKRRLGAILFPLILIVLIFSVVKMNSSHKIPEKVSFMLNNSLTALKQEMYYEDDVAYISKQDVIDLFDNTLYYNEAEKELITTYNTHIAILKLNENTMTLNDSNINLNGKLTEKNNNVYLPLTDLQIVYDLEVDYSKNYNRVIATSTKDEKIQCLITKKTKLKSGTGWFANTIEHLPIGQYVYILKDLGKSKYVRSENGNIGYVKTNKLGNIETIRTKMEEVKETYNIIQNDDIVSNYNEVQLSDSQKNVVCPDFLMIDGTSVNSKIPTKTNRYAEFKEWCTTNDVQIWAGIDINSDVSNLFMTYAERNNIITQIYNVIMESEFQGVMIDFDSINDTNSFNRFLIELRPKLKESGLKIGVKLNDNINEQEREKIKALVDVCI